MDRARRTLLGKPHRVSSRCIWSEKSPKNSIRTNPDHVYHQPGHGILARFGTDKKSKNPYSLQDWPGKTINIDKNASSRPGMTEIPGQSCKEEGFLDFLSVPNRAKNPSHRAVRHYLHGVFELSEAQGRVELGPRRSQELRGSPELQNGGLRALEDAWMTIS